MYQQPAATMHSTRDASQAGVCSEVAWTFWGPFSLSCSCRLAAVSSSEPLKLHIWLRGPRMREAFIAQVHPKLLCFVLSSHPVMWWSFLQCWFYEILSVQWVFCENRSTCRCIFDVFVGEGELHVLLLHRLGLPVYLLFSYW